MNKTTLLPIVFLMPLALTGCGGSSGSSLTGPPTNDPIVTTPIPATVALISRSETAASGTITDDTITVNQTGVATYTHAVNIPPYQIGNGSFQSGSGTLSAAQAAKFFQDLASAKPLSALPISDGSTTSIVPADSSSLTVQYQSQVGHIDDPNDTHEQALAADAAAIAQTLGIPQS